MPAIRRPNLSRRTRIAIRQTNFRSNESSEQLGQRNENERNRLSQIRSAHTQEERENSNEDDMHRMRHYRSIENNRATTSLNNRARRQTNVALNTHRAAFRYNVAIDYSADRCVAIGLMSVVCPHCKALKYRNETPGLCCASGKVKLAPLVSPPEPLRALVSGTGPSSTHFLTQIQKYNNCFQMTSFGATSVVRDNFMPTFKVISTQLYFSHHSTFPHHKYYYLYIIEYIIVILTFTDSRSNISSSRFVTAIAGFRQ